MRSVASLAVVLCLWSPLIVWAAGPANERLQQQQRAALERLQQYDGIWRGDATVYNADGSTLQLIQTERVGPLLGGTLRVIEGRGYMPNGTLTFNAFAVISFTPSTGRYTFRSYAQGYAGDFPLEVSDDGFSWSIQTGSATLRYTSTNRGGVWTEVGERLEAGKPPQKTFEMQLRRVSNTDWPASGAVGPR